MTTAPSKPNPTSRRELTRVSPSLGVCPEFHNALMELGLTSLETVFAFEPGRDLVKANIGRFRRRLQFEATPIGSKRPVRVFLKRYDAPPILRQLGNWLLHHRKVSFASAEREAADQLAAAGVNTPRVVACGERWGILFEQRSFLMVEEIEDSQSLERKLPACFAEPATPETLRARRSFIRRLASFIERFHKTGYRHRDLYLPHIFHSEAGEFCLIDLARASRPILRRRFQIKDLAQLHYSAPAGRFSRTDRVRFFLDYVGRRRLLPRDKLFLRAILRKAGRMARHNVKHGAVPPFLERKADGR